MSMRSAVLLALQFSAIGFLVFTGRWVPLGLVCQLLAAAGLGIIAWAVAVMRLGQLRLQPEPAGHARLVRHGPYRWIRHPMYTGTLLLAIAWLVDDFSPARLIAGLVLLAALVAKARFEESLLARKFPEYPDYLRETSRFFPGIY